MMIQNVKSMQKKQSRQEQQQKNLRICNGKNDTQLSLVAKVSYRGNIYNISEGESERNERTNERITFTYKLCQPKEINSEQQV